MEWLTRHPDRCPVCRAAKGRPVRLSALLHQAAREEAIPSAEAADAFIERLWVRIDRQAPVGLQVMRNRLQPHEGHGPRMIANAAGPVRMMRRATAR